MINKKLLLILIFLAGLMVRVYGLDSYPALNADEAALGYNAYSLLETGRDEHGNPWPIHFQSFNDYKPGLTVYLIMPFVALFGLNEWAVRILPALLGALSPLVLYVLVRELRMKFGLVAAIMLAISPWHIHFSRGAWEVNVATFFVLVGVWAFLKNNRRYYLVSAVAFVLSLYTYHAARIIAPLLLFGLVITHRQKIVKNIKQFLAPIAVGLILLVPLGISFFGPSGISRASGVSIFADSGPVNRINEQRGQHGDVESLQGKLIHNKFINYSLEFFSNWAEHYWGEFLFLSGDDIERNKVPETGQLYMVEFVFVSVGIIMIARRPKGWGFVIWWVLVAPAAAAITFQSPHALRSQNMVIPLTLISSFGIYSLVQSVKPKKLVIAAILLIVSWSLSRYLIMYWGHMAKEYSFSSQYGVEELVDFVGTSESEKILVTDRYDQPYILFLFYLKYPPMKFQQEHVLTQRDIYGFSTVRSFDKYEFRSINFDEDRPKYTNSLIIGTNDEIPEEANIIKEILFPNGSPAFQIVQN